MHAVAIAEHNRTETSHWLHSPLADVALGWCFLPVAIVVHLLGPNIAAVQTVMIGVFALSFAHQPLTLGLVYGDPVQRAAHRRLYSWAPAVATVAILIGMSVNLTVVAAVAILWNAEHTLMQRYGLMRIYGRKVGDNHGSLEKPMLIVWLIAALAFIGAFVDHGDLAMRLGVDETNTRGILLLEPLRVPAQVLFWVAAIVGVRLTLKWWSAERALPSASTPKHLYTLGTLGLVLVVMIDPIAGVAGYVAAHAIEYYAVVHRSFRTRRDDAPIARATRSAVNRRVIYTMYFAVLAIFIATTMALFNGKVYGFAILFFGALHILYDGFVWKLRRTHVAATLGL